MPHFENFSIAAWKDGPSKDDCCFLSAPSAPCFAERYGQTWRNGQPIPDRTFWKWPLSTVSTLASASLSFFIYNAPALNASLWTTHQRPRKASSVWTNKIEYWTHILSILLIDAGLSRDVRSFTSFIDLFSCEKTWWIWLRKELRD
jgi:hypothetical protein